MFIDTLYSFLFSFRFIFTRKITLLPTSCITTAAYFHSSKNVPTRNWNISSDITLVEPCELSYLDISYTYNSWYAGYVREPILESISCSQKERKKKRKKRKEH